MRGWNRWNSWVAIGDSFTEGLSDVGSDGSYVGWADRLAATMGQHNSDFRYANLAVRGKLLRDILDEQLPVVLQANPDLVTICAGGNDLVTPGSDVDKLADHFEQAIVEIRRQTNSEIVIFTGPDPKSQPVVRRVRGKVAIYNGHLRAIADLHGVRLVDLWAMNVLRDRRAWSDDRLHFSTEGHRRIALRAAEVFGVPVVEDWRVPWPPATPIPWLRLRQDDLTWTRSHLWPWVRRQLNGKSSGDGLRPKRPELLPLSEPLTADGQAAGM